MLSFIEVFLFIRHLSLQYLTSSHAFSHFFRQVKFLPQTKHSFSGKLAFAIFFFILFSFLCCQTIGYQLYNYYINLLSVLFILILVLFLVCFLMILLISFFTTSVFLCPHILSLASLAALSNSIIGLG